MTKDIDPNKAASDARADRLDSWVKTHYRNKQQFIEKFGLNQGEITNIIAKKRVIGERKARKIESQTDIPNMYLDGLDLALDLVMDSVSVVEDSYILGSKYPKLVQICKKIDELEENKMVSDAELLAINVVLNNAINTIEDMIELLTKAKVSIPSKKNAS